MSSTDSTISTLSRYSQLFILMLSLLGLGGCLGGDDTAPQEENTPDDQTLTKPTTPPVPTVSYNSGEFTISVSGANIDTSATYRAYYNQGSSFTDSTTALNSFALVASEIEESTFSGTLTHSAAPGTTLYFRIIANLNGMSSEISEEASFVIPELEQLAGPKITTLEMHDTQLTISWEGTATTGFNLYYSSQSRADIENETWKSSLGVVTGSPFTTSPQTIDITLCNFTSDGPCYIAVTAVNDNIESDLSPASISHNGTDYIAAVQRIYSNSPQVETNGLVNRVHRYVVPGVSKAITAELYYKLNPTTTENNLDGAILLYSQAQELGTDSASNPDHKVFDHYFDALYKTGQVANEFTYFTRYSYVDGPITVYSSPAGHSAPLKPAESDFAIAEGTAHNVIRHGSMFYWADTSTQNKIFYMKDDGSDIAVNEYTLDASYLITSMVMETDSSKIYFAYNQINGSTSPGIGSYTISNSSTTADLVTASFGITNLSQDASNLYFVVNGTTISKADKSNFAAGIVNMVNSLSSASFPQSDGTDVYFRDNNGIYSIPASTGSPATPTTIGNGAKPNSFVLDTTNNIIYMTEYKPVGSINKFTTGSPNTVAEVLANTVNASSIGLANNSLYWQDANRAYVYDLTAQTVKSIYENNGSARPYMETGKSHLVYKSSGGLHLIPTETFFQPPTIPAAPTLTLQNGGDQDLDYQWSAVSEGEAYVIVDGSGNPVPHPLDGEIAGTTSNFIEVLGVTNGTGYTYGVKALNISGRSAATMASTLTPQILAPGLSGYGSSTTTTSLTLTMSNITNRSGTITVIVERASAADFTGATNIVNASCGSLGSGNLCIAGSNRTATISDSGLTTGTTYYYRATVDDGVSTSTATSETLTVTTL